MNYFMSRENNLLVKPVTSCKTKLISSFALYQLDNFVVSFYKHFLLLLLFVFFFFLQILKFEGHRDRDLCLVPSPDAQ